MLMYLIVLFLFFFIFLFVFVGVMTVLESKLLSFFQCSEGPFLSYKGLFQFLLDYIKLVLKFNDFSSYFVLSFYCIFFLFCLMMFLPFTFVGFNSYYSIVIIFLFKVFMSLFRLFFCYFFFSKFVFGCSFSLKFDSFIVESLGFIVFLPFLYLIFVNNLSSWWSYCEFFNGFDFLFFMPLFMFYLVLVFYQVSSSPFDFFESESEYVCGIMTSVGGNVFVIWSFIEYSEIFVECSLVMCLFFPFFVNNFFVYSFFLLFFMFFVLLFSCVVPSFDYYTSFKFFSCKFFLFLLVLILFYLFILFCF